MEIRLEGVNHTYPSGVRALQGVDLVVALGEAVALIGPNGSGKSTLLRLLDGLVRPTQGRVAVGGTEASSLTVAALAARVGLCVQDPDRQVFGRTVRAEVEFGPRHLRMDVAARDHAVAAALEATGLVEVAHSNPHDLGLARRKLLGIASVLAMGTPIVALDEPTAGLDARGVARVESIVADLRALGRTIVAASQDLRFVAGSFGRVVVIDGGRITLDGSPSEVFGEASWPILRRAHLEPPWSAIVGARLGVGTTPTDAALIEALRARGIG